MLSQYSQSVLFCRVGSPQTLNATPTHSSSRLFGFETVFVPYLLAKSQTSNAWGIGLRTTGIYDGCVAVVRADQIKRDAAQSRFQEFQFRGQGSSRTGGSLSPVAYRELAKMMSPEGRRRRPQWYNIVRCIHKLLVSPLHLVSRASGTRPVIAWLGMHRSSSVHSVTRYAEFESCRRLYGQLESR
ncbi:hypothetical protein AB1N83_006387 [Pleurotus pulmonarius]